MTTYGATFKEARTETEKMVNMFRSVSAQGPANARGWSINSMPEFKVPDGPRWCQAPSHGPQMWMIIVSFQLGFHVMRWDVKKLTCLTCLFLLSFCYLELSFFVNKGVHIFVDIEKKSGHENLRQGISILRGVPQSGLVRSHQWCSEYGQRRLQPWKIATKSSDHFPSDIGSLLLLFFLFTFTLVPFRGNIIEDS